MDLESVIRSKSFIQKIVQILIDEGEINFRTENLPRDPTQLEYIYNSTNPRIFEKLVGIKKTVFNRLVEEIQTKMEIPKYSTKSNQSWRKVLVTLLYFRGDRRITISHLAGISQTAFEAYKWEVF